MSNEYEYSCYEDWFSFNAETTKELFCPYCGKKVYPLAASEEACEHLFAVCNEDKIQFASEAFYQVIELIYDLPRPVIESCVGREVKFADVANKKDRCVFALRDEDDPKQMEKTWSIVLNGIHFVCHCKDIPSHVVSLYEQTDSKWRWQVFVQFAAKDIASKYAKRPQE